MKVNLYTSTNVLESIDATSVTLPGRLGEFTVLPGHDITISEIKVGVMCIRKDDGEENFKLGMGVAEVRQREVNIYVDNAEKS